MTSIARTTEICGHKFGKNSEASENKQRQPKLLETISKTVLATTSKTVLVTIQNFTSLQPETLQDFQLPIQHVKQALSLPK